LNRSGERRQLAPPPRRCCWLHTKSGDVPATEGIAPPKHPILDWPKMRLLEKAANVAVIAGMAVFIAVIVSDKLDKRPARPQGGAELANRLLGKPMRIPGIQFPTSRNSLVLVLSADCHFCRESLPYCKVLASKSAGKLDVVAVLPQPLPEAEAYLQQAAVPATRVISTSLGDIGVPATPSILLLDRTGKVQDAWVGVVDAAKQRRILSRLQL
jgi:hypothetical protein